MSTTDGAERARHPWLARQPIDSRARVLAGVLLLGAMAGLLAIALKDPRTHGLGVLCPSRRFLGIYCPGCGTTRATYDLLHGEFARAFRHNPLFVILGAPLVAVFIGSLGWTVFRAERIALRVPQRVALALIALLIVYGVARNIPIAALEPLRPPPSAPPASSEAVTTSPNR
ncbi:MAG: hypothetical protein RLY21_404 [Planctomycetota bacterium]|jgi:hypothetical protein